MARLDGKVAFITGVARGQGRSHALRLAEEGANIIGVDICADIASVPYPMANEDELAETIKLVEETGQSIVASVADVRNYDALKNAFDQGVSQLGPVDIVLANAGIWPTSLDPEVHLSSWHDAIDVMVTGTFYTLDITVPSMIERDQGGSIVITSSTAGLKAAGRDYYAVNSGRIAYTTAKHALVGLMRTYANTLGKYNIRVNTVHPTGVNTKMVVNDNFAQHAAKNPTEAAALQNSLPVQLLEPSDISNAVAWLCSDEGRYVTGSTFVVDAGFTAR